VEQYLSCFVNCGKYAQLETVAELKSCYVKLFTKAKSKLSQFTKAQKSQIIKLSEFNFEDVQRQLQSSPPPVYTEVPRRVRLVETVISKRTDRIALVLERIYDDRNQQAVLRTAECLGVQNIYVVVNVEMKNIHIHKRITRGNESFLTIRRFRSTTECIEALRQDSREIWATDLSATAIPLDNHSLNVPKKLALVIGREADGCSKEILAAADKKVYLPMYGFTESLNLSVAAALILQHIFYICPEARGDLTPEDKRKLRIEWYKKLAKNEERLQEYMKYVDNPPPPLEDLRRSEGQKQAYIPDKIKQRVEEKERLIKEEIENERTKKRPRVSQ
jgi:tRNA G18 (ribose-2'-O)-methylase SpoU